jgi:hypothetical protein
LNSQVDSCYLFMLVFFTNMHTKRTCYHRLSLFYVSLSLLIYKDFANRLSSLISFVGKEHQQRREIQIRIKSCLKLIANPSLHHFLPTALSTINLSPVICQWINETGMMPTRLNSSMKSLITNFPSRWRAYSAMS